MKMINVGVSEDFMMQCNCIRRKKKKNFTCPSHSGKEKYSRVKNDKWISLKQLPYTYDTSHIMNHHFGKQTRRIFCRSKE